MFDKRVDTFCLVTSDSDFAYLSRKLRERGATVCIVGEAKTPDALRNASDQFFEWTQSESTGRHDESLATRDAPKAPNAKAEPSKPDCVKPAVKRRPKFVIEAVSLLAGDTSEGKVGLGPLGAYLKRTDPAFSPQTYGHSGLLDMIRTYDLLIAQQEPGNHWSVGLVPKLEIPEDTHSHGTAEH